ncbi:MAG TPA: DUF4349 domain-containing protein [Solirubrobacterales bacterium]|nr:DUF4349 domain-containing protein [Solirubrobacterales bacterium]
MEPFEDDRLVTALESLRPAPRPAFAAELDERAAAGFPRRPRSGGGLRDRLGARVRAMQPRRALVPAGATALAAVAAATVVIAVGEQEGGSPTQMHLDSTVESAASSPPPPRHEAPARLSQQLPQGAGLPQGAVRGLLRQEAATAASSAAVTEQLANAAGQLHSLAFADGAGKYALRARHREIERSAQIVLAAEPAEVRKVAADVFETVHAYRGIVLSSSIRDGAEGEAGARFELLVPSARLGDALAAFSEVAEVRSRHEATADITAPTVRTGEQLRDSRATIESLLAQLSQADTDGERAAAEAKLRAERRHNAYLRSQLASLQRRANLSRVSLRIETGDATSSPGSDGNWGVGDALGDAGHLLAVAAGVTIVGLAVLGPLALIAFLAWLGNRVRVRRARDRALA